MPPAAATAAGAAAPGTASRARPAWDLACSCCRRCWRWCRAARRRSPLSPDCARSGSSRLIASAVGRPLAEPWRLHGWAALRVPAALFGLLLLWGGLSALWAIEPARSLVKDMQLAGLFAAAIALAAAARSIADRAAAGASGDRRDRARPCLASIDFGTSGGLSRYVTRAALRAAAPQPDRGLARDHAAAARGVLSPRPRCCSRIAAAFAMGATVLLLDGTAAKTALLLSLPVAALLYLRRRAVARIAAALSRRRGADRAADPAVAGRRSARAARRATRSRTRSATAVRSGTSPASASPSARCSAGASMRRARYRAARS